MSGFAVLQCPGDGLAQDCLEPALASIAHRGPDGVFSRVDGALALGFCQMQTSAFPERDPLPLYDSESDLAVVADVRLDNRAELAGRLGYEKSRECSDARLILLAYRRWGERCVDFLLGDFAFVIASFSSNELFCARDHLGVRPFYYHASAACFAAASEAEAVIATGRVPVDINEQRLLDCLVPQLEVIEAGSTFYQQVYRLPPAHCMRVSPDGVRIRRYWFPEAASRVRYADDAQYRDAFAELLQQAVSTRLQAPGPVACALSGGVDSSLVSALACQGSEPANLSLFSVMAGEDAACEESAAIRSVADHLGRAANTVSLGIPAQHEAELRAVLEMAGEPFDHSMTLMAALYLQAARAGHRVVLDGVEGDLVHGLPSSYVGNLLPRGRVGQAWRELNAVRDRQYGAGTSLWHVARECLVPTLVPRPLRRLRRQLLRSSRLRAALNESVVDEGFALRNGLAQRLELFSDGSQNQAGSAFTMLAAGLERYDRVASRCGIEPRHPLLDKRLVEFSLGLPPEQKARLGYSKYLLRSVAGEHLPADIAWRQSWQHLGWSMSLELSRAWQARILAVIAKQKPLLASMINWNRLESSLRESDPDDDLPWRLYHLACWLPRQPAVKRGQWPHE